MKDRRARGLLALLAAMILSWPVGGVRRVAAQEEMCFQETGFCISGRFREYWLQNGGVAVFGFPIGPARDERNRDTGAMHLTQWFQRNRFELHTGNRPPYDVLLGRLADERLQAQGRNWQSEGREAGPAPGCLWFAQTGHNVCNQDRSLGFRQYWESNGLQDRALNAHQRSLALFGLPLTAPRTETNTSGNTVVTQWFERARFEWHPGKQPEFKVLLGLLGNETRRASTQSSAPEQLTALDGKVYFAARTRANGHELWRSDGTPGGTVLVKDLVPGPESGSPFQIHAINGVLIFSAHTPDQGIELWRSDGTAAGTYILRDLNPGPDSSAPSQHLRVGDTLFFLAGTSTHGEELWKTNGTAEGTVLVKDIRPGPDSSGPALTERNQCCWRYFTNANGTLYFTADDGVHGTELWRSDGTEAGTQRVSDAGPECVAPTNLANVGGAVFFTWIRTNGPPQLWRTDPTRVGTVLVKDWGETISPLTRLEYLTGVGRTLYFTVNTRGYGRELWKSTGTAEGTLLVRDIVSGEATSAPFALTAVDDKLFFAANDGQGHGLWRSDGTAEGTTMLARVQPVPGDEAFQPRFISINGQLVFFGTSGNERRELWLSDGTPTGTRMVTALPGEGLQYPRSPAVAGSLLFFAHTDAEHGTELWRSNLTAEGTRLVADINTDP